MKKILPYILILIGLITAFHLLAQYFIGNKTQPKLEVPELRFEDLKIGTGESVTKGDEVTIHYSAVVRSTNLKFDSSIDRKIPFSFVLGKGNVISGLDKGIRGMKVGGKRKIFVPPYLAYGPKGVGKVIPPNSWIIYEVELLTKKVGKNPVKTTK